MFDSCLSEFDCRRLQGKIQRPVKAIVPVDESELVSLDVFVEATRNALK